MSTTDSWRSPEREPTRRMTDHLHGFLADLSARGLDVPLNKKVDFLRAVEMGDLDDLTNLYWTARILLTMSLADQDVFDPTFWHWFSTTPHPVLADPDIGPDDGEDGPRAAQDSDGDDSRPTVAEMGSGLTGSPTFRPGHVVFRPTTIEERRLVALLQAELPAAVPRVRSRRQRPGKSGGVLDVRKVVRDASRTYGEVLSLSWRHRPSRQRRLVLLIDVSGSMKQHSADLLRFAHAALTSCDEVEVFTLGTRLTHVTAAMRTKDTDAAIQSLSSVVLDAEGGTRIGHALQEFLANARYVTMARGALVVVFSDGLERGDTSAMTAAVRRLARLSHRVLWWTPLACNPDYRPVTRAMSAVVDDLDALVGVRDLATAREQVAATFPARR